MQLNGLSVGKSAETQRRYGGFFLYKPVFFKKLERDNCLHS